MTGQGLSHILIHEGIDGSCGIINGMVNYNCNVKLEMSTFDERLYMYFKCSFQTSLLLISNILRFLDLRSKLNRFKCQESRFIR